MEFKTLDDIDKMKRGEAREEFKENVSDDVADIFKRTKNKLSPKKKKNPILVLFVIVLILLLIINFFLFNIWLLKFFINRLFGGW